MVGIKRKEDSKPWPEQAEKAPSMAYGLIFGESVKYFDILTTCETVQKQPSVRVQMMDDTMVEGEILGSSKIASGIGETILNLGNKNDYTISAQKGNWIYRNRGRKNFKRNHHRSRRKQNKD